MTTSVIVAGARTPMGRLLGSLEDFSGADLGGIAIKAALDKARVSPEQVDYVIMGQVLTAGAGQIPARQAAAKAGIPMTVPALTINVPVPIPRRKGEPVLFTTDEGIRPDTTVETLATLPPAFLEDGTVTAGSASQISDGAAAVIVMSKAEAEALGLSWIAEIGAHGVVAGPDSTLQSQPSNAIVKACEREGIAPADLDLVEINEAFAAVGIVAARELGLDQARINVNGGAIALGHPLGMSGTRIVLHLALELQRRGGGTGVAALCGGGGQGDALILHVP